MRMTGKDKVNVKETTLGSTLGEESTGLVIFDYEGHPIRFNQITVFEDIVAKHKSVRCCSVGCVCVLTRALIEKQELSVSVEHI